MSKRFVASARVLALALSAAFAFDVSSAVAQVLEEIVVTAQKRQERLQDVPISVSAVTGERLEQMGVTNFENFDVPGIKIARGGMSDTLTVRGIGSGQNPGFDQSAPLYIDGIYYGQGRVIRLAFLDVERVEVLKGPQPTYLGKNAIAGAVNITSRIPGPEFESTADLSYEPVTNEISAGGAVSGALTDKLLGRVALKYRKNDGYLTNVGTGRTEPRAEDLLGRLAFQFNATDDFSARATLYSAKNIDYGRNNQTTTCQPIYFTNISPASLEDCTLNRKKASFGNIAVAGDPGYYFDAGGDSFLFDFKANGGNLQLDQSLPGDATLTALTGYYNYRIKNFTDSDQGIANVLTNTNQQRYWQLSQEVRLASPTGERLKWFIGGYFDHNSDRGNNSAQTNNALALPGSPLIAMAAASNSVIGDSTVDAKSWAAFGDVGYEVVNNLTLKTGLRYEEVKKSNVSKQCTANIYTTVCRAGTLVSLTGDFKDVRLQPAVTLEYRPMGDVLLYANYKQGFKAGGFQVDVRTPTFLPEKVKAYEVGGKIGFLDGRATLNFAAFQADYADLQIASFNSVTNITVILNAAEARSKGIEAEGRLAVTEDLTLGASFSVLDAYYLSYPNAPCYAAQTLALGCLNNATFQVLTGKHLPNSAPFSGTVSATYSHPITSAMKLGLGADTYITDSFFTLTDNNPGTTVDNFVKFNARISLSDIDDKWEIAVVGRNLSNKLTGAFKNATPGGGGSIATFTEPPRTITLQARIKY